MCLQECNKHLPQICEISRNYLGFSVLTVSNSSTKHAGLNHVSQTILGLTRGLNILI